MEVEQTVTSGTKEMAKCLRFPDRESQHCRYRMPPGRLVRGNRQVEGGNEGRNDRWVVNLVSRGQFTIHDNRNEMKVLRCLHLI